MRTAGKVLAISALLGAAALLSIPAASVYYESGGGAGCTRCHEIRPAFDRWRMSSHRNVPCSGCHGDAFTTDAAFHLNNAHRVLAHLRGEVPDTPKLRNVDLTTMMGRCQKCHRQEFADWQAGPHAIKYENFLLDAKHNHDRELMDDCLRCHGMHYEGSIRDLVSPISHKGPWKLIDEQMKGRPAIPCMACHGIHHDGQPLPQRDRGATKQPGKEELARPSIAFFDRRDMRPVALARLPMPAVLDGERLVKMSPDARQAICYQCHATLAAAQVGSGDDRTPIGVHEGLSCLACHQKHRQLTRATCANCHPRLSNCGIDVEKMDTTFMATTSKHNIHWVKCADCHPKGIPPRKKPPARAAD
jgi:hypothetical protein